MGDETNALRSALFDAALDRALDPMPIAAVFRKAVRALLRASKEVAACAVDLVAAATAARTALEQGKSPRAHYDVARRVAAVFGAELLAPKADPQSRPVSRRLTEKA